MSSARAETVATGASDVARLAAVAAVIVAVDQVTKFMISASLTLGESVSVIPNLLDLTLVRNTGMAFGLLARWDVPYKPVLVTVLSLVAMAAVFYYALAAPASERYTRTGLAFILGGALGNVIDRARLGYVVDFVDVYIGRYHWPAFNVADACICVGVGLLVLESFRPRTEESVSRPLGAEASGREG